MKSFFKTLLAVEKVRVRPKPVWRLLRDLEYHSELLGETIVVPAGFDTDFASVPRLPLAWLLVGGKADEAAVVHDMLYSTQRYPRATADAVFQEAIQVLGYSGLTSTLMYTGVRAGGWFAWDKPNLPQLEHVERYLDSGPTAP